MQTQQTQQTEQINVNAFMSLSQIAFSSVERLATLNLNATRAAFDKSLAMSGAMLQATDGNEQKNAIDGKPAEAAASAASYLQEVQAIAADTQKEVADLMQSYFSTQGNGNQPGAAWLKGFDMFKNFGQQITSMTEASGRAITEATTRTMESAEDNTRAIGNATTRAANSVSANSRKAS